MAGDDSPTEKREEFNFGRSTPPPTTSHVAGINRKKKIDGSDMLDGQWIPPKDAAKKHANEEEEDDNCAVKCLYYTMQCCECSIS
ncbi:hypothetical protein MML48_1g19116 [Holotrichia oblita]|uniref:Uncharacterized protein n=1 Tax=Holotrichia oblita TaxID=644536 RepID=A0ACB9TZB2_HOLOL|nr:hypothetical protein MML48_1g19116 [Holotrichia oblita]